MDFSILIFFVSFLAGMLTVFAPCIFTFLPIVLGSATSDINNSKNHISKPIIVIISLAISVFAFSLTLKASTLLIDIPQRYWEVLAGLIILALGVVTLFPEIWDKFSFKVGLSQTSNTLTKTQNVTGYLGYVLTGLALGPIFSSCSPTYGFIIGILLQSTFSVGLLYLISYITGLCLLLFAISILGQSLIVKLKWGINPHGALKRVTGIIFIAIGLLIMTGLHRELEAFIINDLPFLDITKVDRELLNEANK